VTSAGSSRRIGMTKLIVWVGATIGSGIGWWLGHPFGMMSAFMLSIVGTGVGIYAARRVAANVDV
jgi:hypothetical protein